MITNNQLNRLSAQIDPNDYDYDHIGIRCVAKNYDDYNAHIGDVLSPSHVWDDGDYTDDECNGTCAIVSPCQLWPTDSSGYSGDRVLIIGSNDIEGGSDPAEIIMRDPVVLDIINI